MNYRLNLAALLLVVPSFLVFSCSNGRKNLDKKNPDLVKEGWNLSWHDEFNDPEIDDSKWSFDHSERESSVNELQKYVNSTENIYVENGHLVIKALRKETSDIPGTFEITSAKLTTRDTRSWMYGLFEIRAKLPAGKGIWSAVWLMPSESEYGDWPASGEIDIMEMHGSEPNVVYGTLHFGGKMPHNEQEGAFYMLQDESFAADFHVFRLEWGPKEIRWYVDDKHYLTQQKWYTMGASHDSFPAPFDKKFYLNLSLAVGNDGRDKQVRELNFPKSMMVDYVRVYQDEDRWGNSQISLLNKSIRR